MIHKVNNQSMLRTNLSYEEQMLAGILSQTEGNIRAMCRAMQVYLQCGNVHPFDMDKLEETQAVLSAFYTFIDGQMDVISDLARTLEDDFHWVSLETLRASLDFSREKIDA